MHEYIKGIDILDWLLKFDKYIRATKIEMLAIRQ